MFAKFRELRSAKAVMRYLRGSNLLLPVRPLLGPTPHEVVWRVADSARVVQILKNPAYAGAYVMADGARTRCADNPAVSGSGSWPSRPRIGGSVSRTPTRLMLTGTSSWRTARSWWTTSIDMIRAGPALPRVGRHGKLTPWRHEELTPFRTEGGFG